MQLTKWVHEPLWISKVEVIHWPWSKVTQIQHFHFLLLRRPIEAKFYVEPPWDGGTSIWSNGLYHMTRLAAMSIYGKNLKKSSSLEPKGQWPWKLGCSIGYSSTTKLDQMISLGWPWPVLCQSQIWSLMLLYGKKVKQWIFFRNSCSL